MKENFFVRLDDRLVHGQVTQGWLPYLKAEEIIVVSKDILEDPFQKKIISLAVPLGVSITFTSVEQLPLILQNLKKKAIVIFNDFHSLIQFINNYPVKDINLSNYHPNNAVLLERNFWLTEEELKEIDNCSKDTNFYIQTVPTDKPVNLISAIEKWQKI